MPKLYIGITANMKAGKDVVSSLLAQNLNDRWQSCTMVRFSDPLTDVLKAMNVAVNRENLQLLPKVFHKGNWPYNLPGPELMSQVLEALELKNTKVNHRMLAQVFFLGGGSFLLPNAVIKRAKKQRSHTVILNGMRWYPQDIDAVRGLPNNIILGIDALFDRRLARYRKDKRFLGDEHITAEAFQKLHNADSEVGIPLILEKADHIIVNDFDDFAQLRFLIDDFVRLHAMSG